MKRKTVDLSPSMRVLSAEQELAIEPGVLTMGERVGGLSMFANSFKRGAGDKIFGSDEKGVWLGAADFENGKFRVSMDGKMVLTSVDGVNSSYLSAEVLIFYKNSIPGIVVGNPAAAP